MLEVFEWGRKGEAQQQGIYSGKDVRLLVHGSEQNQGTEHKIITFPPGFNGH